MNRLLKYRLVGATTLMLLAVLLIPWILDGPPPQRPDLVKRVADAAAKARQSLPGAESGRPTPGGSVFAPLAVAERPAPSVGLDGEPAPLPELGAVAAARSAAAPVSDSTVLDLAAVAPRSDRQTPGSEQSALQAQAAVRWVVQVATLGSRLNVDNLRQRLSQRGFTVSVQPLRQGARTVYRVRVGPYPDRAAARDAQATVNRLFRVKSVLKRAERDPQ